MMQLCADIRRTSDTSNASARVHTTRSTDRCGNMRFFWRNHLCASFRCQRAGANRHHTAITITNGPMPFVTSSRLTKNLMAMQTGLIGYNTYLPTTLRTCALFERMASESNGSGDGCITSTIVIHSTKASTMLRLESMGPWLA